MTFAERREVLRAGVNAVLVRRAASRGFPHGPIAARVLVFWRGQAPAELTGCSVGPQRRRTWDHNPGSLRLTSLQHAGVGAGHGGGDRIQGRGIRHRLEPTARTRRVDEHAGR